jgi:hypothetical protein
MSILNIARTVNDLVETLIEEKGAIALTAKQLGFDDRSGTRIYLDTDTSSLFIAKHRAGSFEYYSGFSYIDDDQKSTVGDWVVYHHPHMTEGSSRVESAVDFYKDSLEG